MKTLIFLVFIILLSSCEKNPDKCCEKPPSSIYKLRGDYINNVCILISDDNKELVGFPGPQDNCGNPNKLPIPLEDSYYYDFCCNYGINTAYLSISKEQFQTLVYEIPRDSYMYYILDADPYIEYYIDEEEIMLLDTYKTFSDSFTSDTSFLNYLIRRDELEFYFKRLL